MVQIDKEVSQTRDCCVAKTATRHAARPDPSLRKKRLFRMTTKLHHYGAPASLASVALRTINWGPCSESTLMTRLSPAFFRRLTILTAYVAWLAVAQAASGGSENVSQRVSTYVRSEMLRQQVPGLALLVSRGGKIVEAEGFGLANVELQVPVKPETVFQSGSVGKQFTATAVMILVEEGKVGLDDPLTKYFADAPSSWKEVTVRELLSHTAGFGDYPEKFDFRRDWTEADELKLVESIPLAYPPGTKWEYSNLGFLTLGVLIHRVTGEFYGDFLRRRI